MLSQVVDKSQLVTTFLSNPLKLHLSSQTLQVAVATVAPPGWRTGSSQKRDDLHFLIISTFLNTQVFESVEGTQDAFLVIEMGISFGAGVAVVQVEVDVVVVEVDVVVVEVDVVVEVLDVVVEVVDVVVVVVVVVVIVVVVQK